MSSPPKAETLASLQGLIVDCDGVLTDNALHYDENGKRMLSFHAKDGFGLAMLCKAAGFPVAVLSGRPTDIAEHRFRELGVRAFVGRCRNKEEGVRALCKDLGIEPAHCGFMGDDIPDLAGFRAAGLAIAVNDAASEVIDAADWVTRAAGGQGAVREVCEAILKAQGVWQKMLEKF